MDDMIQLVDRQSYILLWELLLLLLRQNGTIVGTDIAELLLKDHEILKEPVVQVPEMFYLSNTDVFISMWLYRKRQKLLRLEQVSLTAL